MDKTDRIIALIIVITALLFGTSVGVWFTGSQQYKSNQLNACLANVHGDDTLEIYKCTEKWR